MPYQYQYSPSAYAVKIENSQEVHFAFVNDFYKFYWPKNWLALDLDGKCYSNRNVKDDTAYMCYHSADFILA